MTSAWIQLYIGDSPKGDVFEVDSVQYVDHLKRSVWGIWQAALQDHIGAYPELKVYSPGTTFPIIPGVQHLDPRKNILEVSKGADLAFIVVAEKRAAARHQEDNGTSFSALFEGNVSRLHFI